MNKDKRNNIQLLGTLNNADESGIIANANQIYDANEDKSTQDVSKEHTERIKTLEDKEDSMQTTLENITKTGEASAASNVTYNHSDSKLDATNVQQAVDEVRKISNYNDGDSIIDFNTIHIITDNPEFAIAVVDINNKILYGIKADGQPYWGVGVPKVVRDYVDKQVNDILGTDNITETIDSLKEVEKFLSDFRNSDTLKALLDTKANKTDVDNTTANINADIADKYKKSNPNDEEGNVIDTNSIKSVINNPEYFKAFVDNTNKLIEAIGIDGVRKFFAGINIQGTLQCVTDNPDYLVAWVDKENRIIFAIQHDGNPYFGYGVPKQIKTVIDNLNTDLVNKYTEVKQSISDTSKHLSETSSDIDKKINLGNDVYPSNVHEVSEFEDNIHVLLDNLNHILESVGSDGVRNFFAGINVKGNKFTTTDNPEYKAVLLDKDNKIIIGIKNDGDAYFAAGVPKQVTDAIKQSLKEFEPSLKEIEQLKDKVNLGLDTYPKDVNTVVDNPEYVKALVDADNKVLEGIEPDGTHKFNNKVNLKGTKVSTTNYEDCSQLLCDKDNKIIDSIDDKGTVTHNSKHIFKGGIEYDTGKIIEDAYNHVLYKSSDLAKVLREKGDMVSSTDWSDSKSLEIPEPRCAYINITSSDGTAATWPTTKTANKKYWMQFWDMNGNYFKKRIIHNAQGDSSMGFPKKNGAIDICNDEWIGDDTFKIKFGNWLAFDSFHLKAYYTDFFKGVSVIAYKLADEVELSRDVLSNRPWKRQLLANYTFGTDQVDSAQINDMSLQLDNEAKCHPDAFPCIVYLDNKFYGIYAFSIKKHRDNYHMNKSTAEHIHLDGILTGDTIWKGTINWKAFEIRNPKNLYYKEAHNGTFEYDADMAQAEIAGDDEVNAWIAAGKLPDGTKVSSKVEKRLKITAKVKNYIIRLSNALATINAETDTVKQKTLFESYFDAPSLVDYEIVQMATGDNDGFGKNWQWITLDGNHWSVCEYDKDLSFGGYWTGEYTQSAPTQGGWMRNWSSTPMGLTVSLYKDDIVSIWKKLTNNNVLTADNIISIADDWIKRIGTDNFKKEYTKWNEAPCCRADLVDTEHWKRSNEYKYGVENNTYNKMKTYEIGETCYYGFTSACKFTAIAKTTGNPPITGAYNSYPSGLGYYDSFWRLANYIKQRISVENDFINSL